MLYGFAKAYLKYGGFSGGGVADGESSTGEGVRAWTGIGGTRGGDGGGVVTGRGIGRMPGFGV